MMRCAPRKTFPRPLRATAPNRSAAMGSARNSRSAAATIGCSAWPVAHAGAPDDRRGSSAASEALEASSSRVCASRRKAMASWQALDGSVAKGDIEGLRFLRVRADERREGGGTGIAFNPAPDGVHIGSDGDQFGEVVIELAVVVR